MFRKGRNETKRMMKTIEPIKWQIDLRYFILFLLEYLPLIVYKLTVLSQTILTYATNPVISLWLSVLETCCYWWLNTAPKGLQGLFYRKYLWHFHLYQLVWTINGEFWETVLYLHITTQYLTVQLITEYFDFESLDPRLGEVVVFHEMWFGTENHQNRL